ncbi:MAG: rod shape-determining protein MreC [Elusimicrobia bacterium]|nr:rod shape-determining protein MreC [Elusimicrobiota bacterium]
MTLFLSRSSGTALSASAGRTILFQRHRSATLFGVYSLVSLALLAWSANRVVQSLKLSFFYLWSPSGSAVVGSLDQWGRVGQGFAKILRADQRARDFESRWVQDRLDTARLKSLEEENKRMADLLGVSPSAGFHATTARVWARDPADWFHSFLVNPGTPVKEGAAVITMESGRPVVVGQVREILPDGKARILLVTDPFSALSAFVTRTGEQGLVEGRGGAKILLNYLFSDSDIRPGDEVVTAGLGEVYPPHLLIGHVTDVVAPLGASSKRAVVSPAARLGFVREVLILSPTSPDPGDKKIP